jgi:two-component system sensor histidine kinase HydH
MLWLNLGACFGSLAVAFAFLLSGARGPLATRTSLLTVTMFAWNFSSLAHDLSRAPVWEVLDLASSPLTVALGLDLALTFVGRARQHRPALRVAYAWFGGISLSNLVAHFVPALAGWPDSAGMSALFLAGIAGAFGLAGAALLGHARRRAGRERRRALLLVGGIVLGGGTGSTVLLNDFGVRFPASAAPGAILGSVVLGLALAHEDLVGARLGPRLWGGALALAGVACGGFLLVFRATDPRSSAELLGAATVALAVAVFAREVSAQSSRQRAQQTEVLVRGRMSDQLVHELRNPLAAIQGAAQFLEAERDTLSPGQTRMVALLLREVARIERLVEEHHRMSRAEPHRTPTNLRELLERLAASMGASAPRHPVTLAIASDAEQAEIDADLVLLALENLVRNARDALPEGGEIRVTSRAEGRTLVLEVQDAGRGFEPRARERAFDELFSTKGTGGGLGLPFVRRVARAHGGEATIASSPDRGTTVTLRLATRGTTPQSPARQ